VSRSTTEAKEFFERVASDWNTMRLAYYDERVIERMAEMSGVGKSSEVADVGIITSFEDHPATGKRYTVHTSTHLGE